MSVIGNHVILAATQHFDAFGPKPTSNRICEYNVPVQIFIAPVRGFAPRPNFHGAAARRRSGGCELALTVPTPAHGRRCGSGRVGRRRASGLIRSARCSRAARRSAAPPSSLRKNTFSASPPLNRKVTRISVTRPRGQRKPAQFTSQAMMLARISGMPKMMAATQCPFSSIATRSRKISVSGADQIKAAPTASSDMSGIGVCATS